MFPGTHIHTWYSLSHTHTNTWSLSVEHSAPLTVMKWWQIHEEPCDHCVCPCHGHMMYRSEWLPFIAHVPVCVWKGWPQNHALLFNQKDHNVRPIRGQDTTENTNFPNTFAWSNFHPFRKYMTLWRHRKLPNYWFKWQTSIQA